MANQVINQLITLPIPYRSIMTEFATIVRQYQDDPPHGALVLQAITQSRNHAIRDSLSSQSPLHT